MVPRTLGRTGEAGESRLDVFLVLLEVAWSLLRGGKVEVFLVLIEVVGSWLSVALLLGTALMAGAGVFLVLIEVGTWFAADFFLRTAGIAGII